MNFEKNRYNIGMDPSTRRGGVFPTPPLFAKKACEYLENRLGKNWAHSGKYRLWDMAAGTGNLERPLTKEALRFCFLSTLEQKDVDYLKKEFPDATTFRYDYLVRDANSVAVGRLPSVVSTLQNDLANPDITWVILVNPPYATAQESGLTGKSKQGVADTPIRKLMHSEGLGEVSRELYTQFLYRIMKDFAGRKAILGLFAPLKYLVSKNYQKFRDNVFHAAFHSGFVFSSENFVGTSKTKHFPVSFILWDIQERKHLADQDIQLDILDGTAQPIGVKSVRSAHHSEFLSRWITRPRCSKIFPPFGSALTIKPDNADTRNRIAEGFLASLMCPGNELQNQQQTAFFSGPQASAGALSVTPDNFEQAVVVFAARRIPENHWTNHIDQFMRPNRELSTQFIADCAVWSLFDNKNQTVSLSNVFYQGNIYRIVNHFFPFPVSSFWIRTKPQRHVERTFHPSSLCESGLCEGNKKNSFVAGWLLRQRLSAEAQDVLDGAKAIYRLYFAHCVKPFDAELCDAELFDVGWYQIRRALGKAQLGEELFAALKHWRKCLKDKILPMLHDYGIIG